MQLNMEKCSVLTTSKVHTHSFLGYKTYLKQKAIDLYSDHCTTVGAKEIFTPHKSREHLYKSNV